MVRCPPDYRVSMESNEAELTWDEVAVAVGVDVVAAGVGVVMATEVMS